MHNIVKKKMGIISSKDCYIKFYDRLQINSAVPKGSFSFKKYQKLTEITNLK